MSDEDKKRVQSAGGGVVQFGTIRSTFRKRAYGTMRIPESVLARVHRRMQVKK